MNQKPWWEENIWLKICQAFERGAGNEAFDLISKIADGAKRRTWQEARELVLSKRKGGFSWVKDADMEDGMVMGKRMTVDELVGLIDDKLEKL